MLVYQKVTINKSRFIMNYPATMGRNVTTWKQKQEFTPFVQLVDTPLRAWLSNWQNNGMFTYQLSSFTTGGGRRFQRGYLKNPSSNGSHQQKSLAGYATRLSCYHHPDSLHTISRHPNIISSWSIISPLQFCVVDNFSPESIIKPIIAPIHHPTIRVGILYPIISPF